MKRSTPAKIILPFVFIVLGLGIARGLMSTKKKASKAPPEARIEAVEFVEVSAGSPTARVDSTGVVEGARQVSLSALVSGEVVWVSDALDPGGRFRSGDALLKVDPRDYEVAVAQEKSRVRQAEVELELEEQRQATAQREWELLGGGKDPAAAPLALRKPQLDVAKQNLESARSGLKRAQLNLERTVLRAPFNAMILTENAEKGQLLSPGANVVTLVGTDRFRVKVSVPVDKLTSIAIPGVNSQQGSPVTAVQDLGDGRPIVRSGRVTGLAGQLDTQTRTADVFVAIDDPLSGDGLPMLPGAFVSVTIEGVAVDGAISVPRAALVGGNELWTLTPADTLAKRTVQIAWRDGSQAFVTDGLEPGARVVVTPPSLPIEGARVRPVAQGAVPESPTADSGSKAADSEG